MSAPFITVNTADTTATHARRIISINQQIKTLRESLESLVAESFQMFDGEGAEQFTMPKIKYGVSSNAEAQRLFNMLNGTMGALNGTMQNANAVDLATVIG